MRSQRHAAVTGVFMTVFAVGPGALACRGDGGAGPGADPDATGSSADDGGSADDDGDDDGSDDGAIAFDPAAPVLPRLTVQQYRNSLEALLGADLPAVAIEPDTNPYLFYNIGATSTTLSELGVQQ